MNLHDKIHQILQDIGVEAKHIFQEIADNTPTLIGMADKLLKLIDSPVAQVIASAFIGVAEAEKIKEALDRVLIRFTHGMIIAEDVANAKSAADKLAIFLADLQKYLPEIQKMKMGDVIALVIHDLAQGGMSINQATLLVEETLRQVKLQSA